MYYFTASKQDNNWIVDSISQDYLALKQKFPNEVIYQWDKPLKSIYLTKYQLVKVRHG